MGNIVQTWRSRSVDMPRMSAPPAKVEKGAFQPCSPRRVGFLRRDSGFGQGGSGTAANKADGENLTHAEISSMKAVEILSFPLSCFQFPARRGGFWF